MGVSKEPARATATITGQLREQPELVWCAPRREYTVNANVGGIDIVAYGDIAKQLSHIPAGQLLRTHVDIVQHEWRTGEGRKRTRLGFVVTAIAYEQGASDGATQD